MVPNGDQFWMTIYKYIKYFCLFTNPLTRLFRYIPCDVFLSITMYKLCRRDRHKRTSVQNSRQKTSSICWNHLILSWTMFISSKKERHLSRSYECVKVILYICNVKHQTFEDKFMKLFFSQGKTIIISPFILPTPVLHEAGKAECGKDDVGEK